MRRQIDRDVRQSRRLELHHGRIYQSICAAWAGAPVPKDPSRSGDHKRACDLGCGNGRMVRALAELGCIVVGVDSSESGIEIARRHKGRVAADFVCADIDDGLAHKLIDGQPPFDVVISSDVIEHMFRPAVLLQVAHKILRPGGLLLVGTPYHGYLKNLAIGIAGKWDAHHGVDWDGGHIKFFSVKTLSRAVETAGFSVQRFEFSGRAPWLWKNMICIARKSA